MMIAWPKKEECWRILNDGLQAQANCVATTQTHPKHGVLKVWASAYEAELNSFDPTHIGNVLTGKQEPHSKCWWMKTNKEIL